VTPNKTLWNPYLKSNRSETLEIYYRHVNLCPVKNSNKFKNINAYFGSFFEKKIRFSPTTSVIDLGFIRKTLVHTLTLDPAYCENFSSIG